jgi:ribonucleotide reductase beta subunit family protein with ferritin-like domain
VMSVFFLGVLPGSIAAPAGILRTATIASTAYSSFYLGFPLVRWLLMWGKNDKISARNRDRLAHARDLRNPTPQLQQKLDQVQRLGLQTRIDREQLIYTTDRDLLDQEIEQRDRLDQEWQKKLEG